jgi:hypothetical protein
MTRAALLVVVVLFASCSTSDIPQQGTRVFLNCTLAVCEVLMQQPGASAPSQKGEPK